jgi:predicted transcriptional regulator
MPGRSVKARDGRSYVTLRIDPDLLERIDTEAEARVVSRTWLIEHVMELWLEEHNA